jgi:hypothetical protein
MRAGHSSSGGGGGNLGGARTEQPWHNDTLSGYVNVARIGQGAYGTVWHARHSATGQEVRGGWPVCACSRAYR